MPPGLCSPSPEAPALPLPICCSEGFDYAALLQDSCEWDNEAPPTASGAEDGALGLDLLVLREPPPACPPPPAQPLPPLPPAALPALGGGPVRPQRHNNRRRARRRAEAVAQDGHIPTLKVIQRHLQEASPLPIDFVLAKPVPVRFPAGDSKRWSLEELRSIGIRVIPWNGRDSQPLLDRENRVIAVLAGQPSTAQYQRAVAEASSLLRAGACSPHRRGAFLAVNCGVLHQQGTKRPLRMRQNPPGLVEGLLQAACFKALAGFASSSYQLWCKGVYQHCKCRLDKIYEHFDDLQRNFPNSVFPAAAFNFGPQAWTFRHRDCLNVPYGMCSVQALGHFDPTKGGHLVLWEFGVAVEFPAGACVLLPSATITHSNIPVAEGEVRSSFTQYVPGGLLRYADNGMRTELEFKAEDPKGYMEMCRQKGHRWQRGLDLLSNWETLARDWGNR
ncbi:hypothetical protein C0991_011051 [Blastosporella zonata]|nr:hypothetical protein C0991_011051 [Blastosporella zonata]